jgi:TRAP transporter TAXI family solute receptor
MPIEYCKNRHQLRLLFFTALIFLLNSCESFHKKTVFTIGSGSKNAMYYPVASALCEVFNKHNQDKNILCQANQSKGAEYNLDAIENGEFDMGISQTNLQYDAYTGRKKFANNPHKKLRTLFTIHDEYLTIIAKKNSKVNNFYDLRGKKVNIGNKGSGSRILFSQMIKKLGWNLADFKEVYEESGSNIKKVICSESKAEAAIYLVGHPNKSFKYLLDECDSKLIGLSKSETNLFISLSPKDFYKIFIPERTYGDNSKIRTFASKTVLSASTNLNEKTVQNFVKIISSNKAELIQKQPALITIQFFQKNKSGLAPLHQGLSNLKK